MAPQPPVGRSRVGFTLIELIVVIAIIGLLAGLTLAAVQQVRQAAARADCQNRLRQLPLAAHQYHDAHRHLPPGFRSDGPDPRYMSWLTRLLPHLEHQPLYDRAVRDYARQPKFWLPPEGHANLSTPVAAFTCPAGDRASGRAYYPTLQPEPFPVAFTWYLGVSGTNSVGKDGVLFENSAVRFADVRDGLSNTLLAGERPPSPDDRLGWWYAGVGLRESGRGGDSFLGVREPRDAVILPMCPDGLPTFRPGRLDDLCDVVHFWSRHPGGAHFAFCDGSVRFLRYSADSVLPALATRGGGETVPVPD